MSDNYPWFKFDAESWLSGSVQFQPPEYQSVFINIASLYWKNKRPVTEKEICVRYPRDKQMVADALQSLADACLIKVIDDRFIIAFMSEQMSQNDVKSDKKRIAANKRWHPDAGAMQVNAEEKREDETRGDEEDNASTSTTSILDYFKNQSCFVPNEDSDWYVTCFKRFTTDFLHLCIKACKDDRSSKGLAPRPCRSDLTIMIEKQALKYGDQIFKPKQQEQS